LFWKFREIMAAIETDEQVKVVVSRVLSKVST